MSEQGSLHEFYTHAVTSFDADMGAMWFKMKPSPRPCVTPHLLSDATNFQRLIAQRVREQVRVSGQSPIRYLVVASAVDGIYNAGGDLGHFANLIRNKDRSALVEYAHACVAVTYRLSANLEVPLTTVALVQGEALGGGFELALACNVIIAEKQAQFGLPEMLFNLFPGMGAYTFLSRRIGPALAERMILSGRVYSATELYDMGLVDVLADEGQGEQTLREFVRKDARSGNTRHALNQIRTRYNAVSYSEMMDITELWVDSALRLDEKALRTMERLVRAQDRRAAAPQTVREVADAYALRKVAS